MDRNFICDEGWMDLRERVLWCGGGRGGLGCGKGLGEGEREGGREGEREMGKTKTATIYSL